jgi:CRP-like cAMP-binding protein
MACDVPNVSRTLSCLRRVPIFEGLTEQELARLYCMIKTKNYEKGECVFREGEHSESFYVLEQGVIKLSIASGDGKEQILRFLLQGDFFGQFAMLQDKPHYADAEVIENSVVYQIDKCDMLQSNQPMTYRFLLAVAEQLHQADVWMGAMNLLEIEPRLAKILYFFHQKNGNTSALLDVPVAKKRIGRYDWRNSWVFKQKAILPPKSHQLSRIGCPLLIFL